MAGKLHFPAPIKALVQIQGYIFWPFPPPWGGGKFLSKMKNREEFEGGLHEKRKGKGGKRRKEKKKKEKREKGKKRMERDKKWIRVLKGKIILSLFCFPVFGYVP